MVTPQDGSSTSDPRMNPPRKLLEGTDLVAYVVVSDSVSFTGRLNLYVDGERLGRVACLAQIPDGHAGSARVSPSRCSCALYRLDISD